MLTDGFRADRRTIQAHPGPPGAPPTLWWSAAEEEPTTAARVRIGAQVRAMAEANAAQVQAATEALRQELRDAGWSADDVAAVETVVEGCTGMAWHARGDVRLRFAIEAAKVGVPAGEVTAWMRVLIARRFDSMFHSEALAVVTGYVAAAGGDHDLGRAGWAAGLVVEDLARQVAEGPVDVHGLLLLAGLTEGS